MTATVVYVVDDDDAVRDSLRLLLEEHGFDVRDFATSEALLIGLADRGPDCLILDLHLPDIDGLEVMRRLAAHAVRPPVIAITGRSDPASSASVMALGASALLEKPFELDQLLDAIRRALT